MLRKEVQLQSLQGHLWSFLECQRCRSCGLTKDIDFEKMKLAKGKERDVLMPAAQKEKQRPKKRSLLVEVENDKNRRREREAKKE